MIIKTGLGVVLSTTMLFGFFMPNMDFSLDRDSDNIDTNYVRVQKEQIVLDQRDKKMYYDSTPSKKMHFFKAWEVCQKMDYLHYTNWRVPTKDELKNLLELSRPRVKSKHAFENVSRDLYWTSTKDQYESAWFVDFDLGRYSTAKYNEKLKVMCVRNLER